MRQKRILFMAVALLLALALAVSAQASVTTKKSGPAVGTHKAQKYVLDIGTNVVTNKSTGEEVTRDGLRGLPPLFPGDTVEFRSAEGTVGYEFYDSNGDPTVADKPGKDGKIHVHVTGTGSFAWEDGSGKPLGQYYYITKVEITGNELVQLADGTFHTAFGPNHEVMGLKQLKYSYVPLWCSINTEIWLEDGNNKHEMSSGELAGSGYYTSEKSSTRAWAEDALTNGYSESHKDVLLTARRPYIEGRFFTGVKYESGQGKTNQISRMYRIYNGEAWHGNYWEGWMDNQVEFHVSLQKNGGGFDGEYSAAGSYKDEVLVRFLYCYGRTVTFDACGGTIDGYPSRIYEAEGRQYFNEDLQSGKVDEEFAAGKAYVPVRKGYDFDGWYEDPGYQTPVTSIKDAVNKYDTGSGGDPNRICRLYAKWSPKFVSGWKAVDGKWMYYLSGKPVTSDWICDAGAWYYFDANGFMVTGWQSVGGKWYYFSGSGCMKTGWISDGGSWYYLSGSGAMATGWIQSGGSWYYLNPNGTMATGWLKDTSGLTPVWYWFDNGGTMATGWKLIDGSWEMFSGSGAWLYTWNGK